MLLQFLDRTFKAVVYVLVFAVSSPVYAATFSNIYIFGDSLSDTDVGLSNGDLWPVYFSPQVGVSYNSANNYAVSGATTTNLTSQVSFYQADANTADPSALYVIWAGGNDLLSGGNAIDAANNVIDIINNLSVYGAEKFLVPNLPDLGLIPAGGGVSALTDASILFNSTLDLAYSASSNVLIADVFGFHHSVLNDPAAFGLTNATESCLFSSANCDTYLFWDNIHPTTIGHSLIANEFASSFVPVPAAIWLFGSGLISLIGLARKKTNA